MLIASSVLWNETTIRRKDLRGENECKGALVSRRLRTFWRAGAEKIAGSRRFVMSRVFEGGAGVTRGGREDRSR